jgi:hypothetical protein
VRGHGVVVSSQSSDYEATGTLELLFRTMRGAGHIDEAEAVGRRSLALNEKIFGAEHSRAVVARLDLGEMLARHGRVDEGLAMMRECIEIVDRKYPEGTPDPSPTERCR